MKLSIHKGQVSFEFIIVLAVVVLLSSVIMLDAINSSADTSVLAAVKSSAANRLSLNVLTDGACAGSYLNDIVFSDFVIELEFTGPSECTPTAMEIANDVENEACSLEPNNDDMISCSGDTYIVKIK